MKKINKIILLLAIVLLVGCLFAACTENTKQTGVETSTANTIVTSNGGVAVQYGNYLYFVNGYVGSSALNTFGSVKTGAICRVEIKKNADGIYYDYNTFAVIVPKNVYGTDTTNPGIYIAGDYVYYHTTSVDKNSKREYKTDEGVLMRTKLDGSVSEQIAAFSDNSTVFRVAGNYLVYVVTEDSKTMLHAVNLSNLKDNKVLDENGAVAYTFSDNYVVFTTYNYDRVGKTTSDYLVKIFDFQTGKTSLLLSSDIYNNQKDGPLYITTIKSVQENDNVIVLFYTKDDDTNDDINNGYYYTFIPKASLKFSLKNEYRMTFQMDTTTYNNFYQLKNGWILAYHDKVFEVYDTFHEGTENSCGYCTRKQNEKSVAQEQGTYLTYKLTSATALVGVYETDDEVYAYFTTSPTINDTTYTALNYFKLFSKTVENQKVNYVAVRENVAVFFYFNYDSTYTTYEVTDLKYYGANGDTSAKAVYFLNKDLGAKAFASYFIIQNNNDKEDAEKEPAGKILGKIDGEDLVSLVSSGKVEEDK